MSDKALADKIIELVIRHTLRVDRGDWPIINFVEWLDGQKDVLREQVASMIAAHPCPKCAEQAAFSQDELGVMCHVLAKHGHTGCPRCAEREASLKAFVARLRNCLYECELWPQKYDDKIREDAYNEILDKLIARKLAEEETDGG